MSNKNNINISCIIVTYNSHKFIKKCLNHLLKSSIVPGEIIIIDNNSKLSPKKIIGGLKNKKTNIRIIENKKNLGFAKAVNLGIKLSSKDNVLLINPDFFVDKNAILNLYKFQKNKNIIVGGKIYYKGKSKIQKTVVNKINIKTILTEFTSLTKILNSLGIKNPSGFWNEDVLVTKKPKEVTMVSGCFILFHKSVFEKIKGFDENFFLYLEDLDFCLRAKEKGIKTFFLPSATGQHISGASSINKKNKINQAAWDKSKRYFTRKYFKKIGELFCFIYDIDDIIIKLKKSIIP